MNRTPRIAATATMVALVLHGFVPGWASTGASIEGSVQIPCDPSRVAQVAVVQIRPVAGGAVTTLTVDSSTGEFATAEVPEGEYDVFAIGTDGQPLSREPKRLVLASGPNKVFLTFQPPGCGEPDSDYDGVPDAADACPDSPRGAEVGTDGCPTPGKKGSGRKSGLEDWQMSLIYFGVVGVIAVAVANDDDDDEDPASPTQP
jgi:hypothetical protein